MGVAGFLTFDSVDRAQGRDHWKTCFIRKLLSTFLWSCLFFSIIQFVIFENLLILELALSEGKELNMSQVANFQEKQIFHF